MFEAIKEFEFLGEGWAMRKTNIPLVGKVVEMVGALWLKKVELNTRMGKLLAIKIGVVI